MERIDRIIHHRVYRECLEEIRGMERDRAFCRHDMQHFLDVARLAYLLSLEERQKTEKELIYAAALLHDIGRGRQYRDGTGHERAGAELAGMILPECGFSGEETREIIGAVLGHRKCETAAEKNLAGLLYRADKLSRNCFACASEPDCNWSEEKKNLHILY